MIDCVVVFARFESFGVGDRYYDWKEAGEVACDGAARRGAQNGFEATIQLYNPINMSRKEDKYERLDKGTGIGHVLIL